MTTQIRLYTRKDCCLCQEMKAAVRAVEGKVPMEIEEIDVDSTPELKEKYGSEVPLLFINGRKAFKYRVGAKELEKRLRENGG